MTALASRRGLPAWPQAALALAAAALLLARPMPGGVQRGMPQAVSQAMGVPGQLAEPQAGGRARPATVVRPLSCAPLPDAPGKSLSTMLVEFPPGAFTGPHRHPGSVSAFVVSGAIRSQLAGTPARVYAAGQTWFEPPMALHAFAENASASEPAVLLATFVADDGCRQLVIPEHAAPR
jgi:quercetin dioxygenase-like cupin family protein